MGGVAQLWMDYGGLQAAMHMTVPIGLGLLVLLFVILQSQIDRRDPKLARAQSPVTKA